MDRFHPTPSKWKAALGALMAVGLGACQSDSLTAIPRPALHSPSAALAVTGSDFELELIGSPVITNGYGINDRDEAVGHRDGLPCASVGAYHCPTIWVPGQQEDVFLNLGGPPGGEAVDINNDGWVVGWNPGAFVWLSSTRQTIQLEGGCPRAFGINNLGSVVGQDVCSQQALLWQPTQPGATTFARVDLPLLPSTSSSAAYEINDAGQIIGQIITPGISHAVLWQPSSPGASTYTIVDLGTLGSPSSNVATDINSKGEIVGVSPLASGVSRAFRWTPDSPNGANGVMSDLGALNSSGNSQALGINDDGIIVGDCDAIPVVWSAAGISTLPYSTYGYARAINNRGTIVGASGNLQTAIWRLGNRAPIARIVAPSTALEGTAVTFDGTTSSDPDSDALTYAWTFGDGGSATGPTPTHTYADNGPNNDPFTIALTVTDAKGATSTTSVSVPVDNVAPTITSLTGPTDPIQLVSSSASATVSVAFADPAGAADTYSVRVDCGNGTIIPLSGAASPSTPVCPYTEAGVYTVRATVSDEDGGTSTEVAHRYVVVYDPTGGFVTGGGWIESPVGACQLVTACQAASGKATLGFVSRYQKGATEPTGNTEFEFTAGNLNFRSTSYQWLVVSGARAQYKGDGTIDGSGDYGFLLTAIDGALDRSDPRDRFRIKIWDKATGNTVYDNRMGEAELSDAATALGGGSIVIHSK